MFPFFTTTLSIGPENHFRDVFDLDQAPKAGEQQMLLLHTIKHAASPESGRSAVHYLKITASTMGAGQKKGVIEITPGTQKIEYCLCLSVA
jgi:hypothetical protein